MKDIFEYQLDLLYKLSRSTSSIILSMCILFFSTLGPYLFQRETLKTRPSHLGLDI
jgi:hypothetical protein